VSCGTHEGHRRPLGGRFPLVSQERAEPVCDRLVTLERCVLVAQGHRRSGVTQPGTGGAGSGGEGNGGHWPRSSDDGKATRLP
jgi:hypothetical protein